MKKIKAYDEFGTFKGKVVIDTREQRPYQFLYLCADAADGRGQIIVLTETAKLNAGDYSLAGHEREFAIERKSFPDLFGTLGSGRDRFERELERLKTYKYAAIVVEAQWSKILKGYSRSQLNPKTVFRSVIAWQQRYPAVHWWFCVNRSMAETTTFRIIERFWREQAARTATPLASIEGR